jgi:hypothetical protein
VATRKRKAYVSTVRPSSGETPGYRPVTEEVKQHDGVRVGEIYRMDGKGFKVLNIYRRGRGAWEVSFKHEDGYRTSLPLSQIAKVVRSSRGRRRPVAGCYALGPGRIRRRKVNRSRGRRHPVSGCYSVGPGRIRRRKVNPTRRVVLYAQKPGGPLLKFLGTKFARKGNALLYRDEPSAKLAAWALKDSFPKELKGYRLFWK